MDALTVTTSSTDTVPAVDRLAYWSELATQAHFPCHVFSTDAADFQASMRVLSLGAVQLAELTYSTLRVWRTRRLIDRRDPEVYQLNLLRRGVVRHSQDELRVRARPGEWFVRDSSRAFESERSGAGDLSSAIVVQVPRVLVTQRVLGPLAAGSASAASGTGALLAQVVRRLLDRSREFTPNDRTPMERVVVDLIAAFLAPDRGLPPASHQVALFERISAHIAGRLADPGLTPRSIAAAHGISVRGLHKLFETHGDGVSAAAWIRRLRLEQCRRDLADPRLGAVPAYAIGSRWAFADAAHFTRLFRATYGCPPGDYRDRHQ